MRTQILVSEALFGEMADSRTGQGMCKMNVNILLYHRIRKHSKMMGTH